MRHRDPHLQAPHLPTDRVHRRVGHPGRRRQGQGAEGGGRERHRLRRRRARLPDPAAHRRGGGRRLPGREEPPLHARRRAAGAAGGHRRQDQARLRVRLRGRPTCSSPTAASTPCSPPSPCCATRATRCICPAPYWTTYPEAITLAGGVPVVIATDEAAGFRVTVEQLEAARTPRTKVLLFVSPDNPTGAVYPPEEVEAIGRWARRRTASGWSPTRSTSTSRTAPQRVHLDAGARARAGRHLPHRQRRGQDLRHDRLAGRLDDRPEGRDRRRPTNFQSHATSNVANVAQRAALAAVSGDLEAVAMMRAAFERRGRTMHRMLNEIPGVTCLEPQGAFYCFPSFEALLGREIGGRTVDYHARAGRRDPRRGQGGVRAGRGVRQPGLHAPLVRARRRGPRRWRRRAAAGAASA